MAIRKQVTSTQVQEEEDLVPVRWLTEEEAFAVLDMQAPKRLNMSGAEFSRSGAQMRSPRSSRTRITQFTRS